MDGVIRNRFFLLHFGGKPGDLGGAKIPMVRPKESDRPPKRTKVRLGISPSLRPSQVSGLTSHDISRNWVRLKLNITIYFFIPFCFCRDLCRLAELQKVTQERNLKQHLVTLDWVTQSVEAEKLLPERHFRPIT